jgi:sugar-specific transcriptional regulator TrmB
MTPQEGKSNPPLVPNGEKKSSPQCPVPIEISPDLLLALQVQFNLSESQSRVYTALLIMGRLAPGEISLYSDVPLVKVESTIDVLVKKQLVKPLPGVVTRYRAFAPYKELANEVQGFSKETRASWKELQKLQDKTTGEIHSELQSMTRQIRSALENLNERQGIALNEAAMSTNIVLSNVAEELQKTLTNLSSSSTEEISGQTTALQQSLRQTIGVGIKQFEDTQNLALDDVNKAMKTHREETEQWITVIADRLLNQADTSTQQVKSHLEDANSIYQRSIDSTLKTLSAGITAQKEGISETTEETAINLTNNIDAYSQESQQALATFQADIEQTLSKSIQDINTQVRDVWTHRTQALDEAAVQMKKTLKKDLRHLTRKTNKAATELDTTIKASRKTAVQITNSLFQELKKSLETSSQEYKQLREEAETTIAQWPPTALTFIQFSKIKSDLATITEQVKAEHEQILETASEGLGVEMRDTYLANLLEVRTLIQSLIKKLAAKQNALYKNFKSMGNHIGRHLKRQQTKVQKTTESVLTDFQAKIALQEVQNRTLGKRAQNLVNQETNAVLVSLKTTKDQIGQYAQNRIRQTKNAVKQAASENITNATKTQKIVDKQLLSFKAALNKITKESTSELQKEFSQLENIVKQYSDGIETTADRLRQEQIVKVETAIAEFQPSITEIQNTREAAIAKAVQSHSTQLSNRDQKVINGLSTSLSEVIPPIALAALDSYQTTLKGKQASFGTQAAKTAQSAGGKQVTKAALKRLNKKIITSVKTQLDTFMAAFLDFSAKEQAAFNKQSDITFKKTSKEFSAIQNGQIEKFIGLMGEEYLARITTSLRNCKTKVSRQTKREKQVDTLFQKTLNRALALPKTLLPKEKKAIRDKLTNELTVIFKEFREQLRIQIDREPQISKIFEDTLLILQQFPQELLPGLAEQHLNSQAINLQSTFVDYQSVLDKQQKDYAKNIVTKLRSLHEQLLHVNYSSELKTPITNLVKKGSKLAVESFQTTLANRYADLEVQANTAFQTTLDKRLRTHLSEKLREYQDTQAPPVNTSIQTLEIKLGEVLEKYDASAKTRVDRYWLPITKIIDDYSSIVAGNLNTLNTAISTIVDQATVNVTTTLTNFGDDASNLLTATAQAFEREKTGFNEQITQGINEMKEDCLAQLNETQTLLGGLAEDIIAQETTLTQKMETMSDEIETTTDSNLSVIRETAETFVESIQNELQSQSKRVENLVENIRDLILEQSTSVTATITEIQTQLEDFDQNQITKSQGIIEDIGQTCATKIDEQRNAIDKHLGTFATSLLDETEDYVSTLQQEIIQLQTIASKLVETIGNTGEAIDIESNAMLEMNKVNLLTAIDEQQASLNKESSSVFQSLAEQLNTIEIQLIAQLTQNAEEGKEGTVQSSEQIKLTLDENLNQVASKSAEIIQAQQINLTTHTSTLSAQLREKLSAISTSANTTSDQLIQLSTSTLTGSQKELSKIISDTNLAIDEDKEKLRTAFGQDIEQNLQSYVKSLDLIKTRLARATQDSIRHTNEVLLQFEETALTDIQQRNSNILVTVQQITDTAEEGLVTQTQQTGRRISRTLSKERQALKTEYQTLAKEITSRAKSAETKSVNTLQLFSAKTEPILERLRTQAIGTEQTLTGLWETLSTLQPAEAERTWQIVTCEGIQNHLFGMFRRVNETVTLVYPSFEEVPIDELSKVKPESRVHIITTLDGEKHLASAKKLLQQGNIRIWDNPDMTFYGGSRDGEEVLIAPTAENQGEIVAVVSDQASYISLFNRTLGPRWISASQEISLRS